MVKLKYYGHANFQLDNGEISVLIDPFFNDNPVNAMKVEDVKCNYILVSHAHFDHIGDAIEISKRTGATIISTAEIANMVAENGCKSHAMHIGGKCNFEFGFVKATMALHGSGIAGGHAAGFIINFFGKTIYFAGDTALFGDMELIGRLNKIDYALLPIGDNFTMGPEDAIEAVGLLNPKTVVPMHYNTWPLIEQSPQDFKTEVENRFDLRVEIINFGESIDLQ